MCLNGKKITWIGYLIATNVYVFEDVVYPWRKCWWTFVSHNTIIGTHFWCSISKWIFSVQTNSVETRAAFQVRAGSAYNRTHNKYSFQTAQIISIWTYLCCIGLINYHTAHFSFIVQKHIGLHFSEFALVGCAALAPRTVVVCAFAKTVSMSGHRCNQITFTIEMESSIRSYLTVSLFLCVCASRTFICFPNVWDWIVYEQIWWAKFIRVVFKFDCTSAIGKVFACEISHGNGMIWISYFRTDNLASRSH